ncbi:MAG: hypothetical protein ACLGJB_05330 [Blastocatellia bacterium]
MEERNDIQRLLVLRKLTRSISDLLRGQMKEYLSTLAPLLRPKVVLGDYIQGSTKELVKNADKTFKELQSVYEAVATAKPFFLSKELKPPLEILSSAIEITPMGYSHVIQTEGGSKTVTITSPLKWVVNYSGFTPGRLSELLADRGRNLGEVQTFIIHYLVMHIVVSKQPGITKIFDSLHFPFSTGYSQEFGDLPLTFISSSVSTALPPDEVILQSTEVSGTDAFEEVVNLDDIQRIREPLKEELLELVRSHSGDALSH